MTSPMTLNYSTITDPLTRECASNLEKVIFGIKYRWLTVGRGFDIKIDAAPVVDQADLINISDISSRCWGGAGPLGRGMLCRILEIALVFKDKELIKRLDDFIRRIQTLFGKEDFPVMETFLNQLQGKGKFLTRLLTFPFPSRLQKLLELGVTRRLAAFRDGLGKVRYVAIRD